MIRAAVGLFFLTLGCANWSRVPVNAALDQPATLRLHLRDGSTIMVQNAVVSADSIVGSPWGGSSPDSRVSVARARVDRIDIGETDAERTTALVVGIIVFALGAIVVLATHSRYDPS